MKRFSSSSAASSSRRNSAAELLTAPPGGSSAVAAGPVAGPVAPGVYVAEEPAAAAAAPAAGQAAGPAGAVGTVDWELSAVEGRWSAVAVGRKAVAVDWTAACCFPDASVGRAAVEESHFEHRVYCGVERLDAVVVFAGRVVQQHWHESAVDARAPVALAGAQRTVAVGLVGGSGAVHEASVAECASAY